MGRNGISVCTLSSGYNSLCPWRGTGKEDTNVTIDLSGLRFHSRLGLGDHGYPGLAKAFGTIQAKGERLLDYL